MKSVMAARERSGRSLRDHLGRTAIAYAVLAVALVLTALAYHYVKQNVEGEEHSRFEEAMLTAQRAVDRRMDTYIDAMLQGRGLFAASESVTREEWHEYVAASDLANRYPGIRALGYAGRVRLEGREAHVDALREEGFASYAVRPAGERYEYFPLEYVEPFDGPNRSLLGYDFYSDPVNRSAMEQARDTGLPRASGKVDLGRFGYPRQPGFLVYTPVYRGGAPQETADERREALQGYIVSVFDTGELLEGIFGAQAGPQIGLEVFDGAEPTPTNLLHDDDRSSITQDGTARGGLRDVTTLEVAGRIWSLHFDAPRSFGSGWQANLPPFVLLSGLAISLMLFGITWMLAASRFRAERVGLELESANRELEAANRDLEATNRELEGANQELEAFSYSVSHDLRAPLRSIDGFSQILLEDYADDLNEEGRGYLRRVRAGSRRMALLIDDLLDLSRVTRSALRHQSVDLSAIARETASELENSESEREAEFVIAGGLVASGDPRLLRLVLENLLSNAWKFTREEHRARIEFGAVRREGEPAYYVRDNGVGFDMQYADKLFGAFQRLHSADEFEGTGIGLATVARIVHRHGGRVWAEG
ncbi:MAG TPA: CHASE domain-containing protein, partial [Rubrobacteraceae bacterium]|nr:CHASE domain-containing protein [Rubrobacteraceae bacterium]